jgi:hypothetical protein
MYWVPPTPVQLTSALPLTELSKCGDIDRSDRHQLCHLKRWDYPSECSKPKTIEAHEDGPLGSLTFFVDLDRHFYTLAPEESNGGWVVSS